MQDFKSLAGERFSARKFTAEPVCKEDLEYIMECVRLAPSACNRQPWKWLIVCSEEAMKKLQECYDREWFKTAPMLYRRYEEHRGQLGTKVRQQTSW